MPNLLNLKPGEIEVRIQDEDGNSYSRGYAGTADKRDAIRWTLESGDLPYAIDLTRIKQVTVTTIQEPRRHGGTRTVLSTLPVGTKFYVHNGAWNGEIIDVNNQKKLLIEGDNMKNARNIVDGQTLDISIR